MEYHRGRLFDHVQLRVRDLEASKRFYRAVLGALDPPVPIVEGNGWFYADELFFDVADGPTTRVHRAFQANSRAVVSTIRDGSPNR
jgi:catechol 2,3-dioxygenase-like lactoylglutathione lyase family enzyme